MKLTPPAGAPAAKTPAPVVLFSHGDPIKSILAHALGMPLDNLDRLEISPASVSVLVAGEWGMRVFSVNEAAR